MRGLYQEMILDHARSPRNFGKLEGATHTQVGVNPLCGDKLYVSAYVANGVIHSLKFDGEGCAISMASASLMSEVLVGKTLADAQALFDAVHALLMGDAKESDALGKLVVLGGVSQFPARVKCASLAWHTALAALNDEQSPVSTEEEST